jgi:hypothetical protein
MHQTDPAKRTFIALWTVATLCKFALAARLPLFVDEAFYWQEGRHPAWAYSDLPGMTAWLVRLGESVAGPFGLGALGLRWPFLLIAAALPWWLVAIARRELGPHHAWTAGTLALLLPLLGTLGLLALPMCRWRWRRWPVSMPARACCGRRDGAPPRCWRSG